MSLTEFLLARIAEDEQTWRLAETAELAFTTRSEGIAAAPPVNFARRMIADCEAKRRIVELHAIECYPDDDGDWYCCDGCSTPMVPHPSEVACPTLKALALPYADHDDYREEWKP